jgi:acetyl-CoA carboxylase carboxyltransferase component
MTHSISVPLLNVNVRRAYGFGGSITSNGSRMTARFAWPSAEFGGIPIEGGVDAAFKRVIESAEDPDAKRAEIESRLARLLSPFPAAEKLGIEDVIDPRETRPRLIRALESALPRPACSSDRGRAAGCVPRCRDPGHIGASRMRLDGEETGQSLVLPGRRPPQHPPPGNGNP